MDELGCPSDRTVQLSEIMKTEPALRRPYERTMLDFCNDGIVLLRLISSAMLSLLADDDVVVVVEILDFV